MRYLPIGSEDERRLLKAIGKPSVAELFEGIPEELRFEGRLPVPGPCSEVEIGREIGALASLNAAPADYAWFLGAGAYRHDVSCIVDHILARAEFATAYTPYQPEVAQGTLQAIFEFQSLVCQLTGCEVANASVYDGPSAMAEAALMALRLDPGRRTLLVSRSLHPHTRAIIETNTRNLGVTLRDLPPDATGRIDPSALGSMLDGQASAVLLQSPNFFGVIEDVGAISKTAHDRGALVAVSVLEPVSLGVVAPPGQLGADIVTGEAMTFASSPSFGGPAVGFFATREKFVRNLPGRLCGETVDRDGKRGFVLTLSTREQHIRRERATSNICTNQGLVMLAATVGMCLYGKSGIREMALRNLTYGEELKRRLFASRRYAPLFSGPTFNEIAVQGPKRASDVLAALRDRGVVAGPGLAPYFPDRPDAFLVTVTERNTLDEIGKLVSALESL
ncbi:MAG: aminomethyl-transferring glycine dehydrogenase subunit GcvPA [Acidobacteriota bacterium]